jgi:hypothetical protein
MHHMSLSSWLDFPHWTCMPVVDLILWILLAMCMWSEPFPWFRASTSGLDTLSWFTFLLDLYIGCGFHQCHFLAESSCYQIALLAVLFALSCGLGIRLTGRIRERMTADSGWSFRPGLLLGEIPHRPSCCVWFSVSLWLWFDVGFYRSCLRLAYAVSVMISTLIVAFALSMVLLFFYIPHYTMSIPWSTYGLDTLMTLVPVKSSWLGHISYWLLSGIRT